jgi:hypothetical protein
VSFALQPGTFKISRKLGTIIEDEKMVRCDDGEEVEVPFNVQGSGFYLGRRVIVERVGRMTFVGVVELDEGEEE